jgi:hypothetical protein
MARIRDRMARRHVREKAVVQHVAKRLFEPKASADAQVRDATTPTGLSVEGQVRKKWSPRKGGLPIFCRK